MTTFYVHFREQNMQGKNVLAFLKPTPPQSNYQVHAWQVLTGSAGATETFSYKAEIQVDVTSAGRKADNVIVSGRQIATAGQLYEAISPSGLSPKLIPASETLANQKLTPNQCGVINKTSPFIQFTCNWYVNNRAVASMPYVDRNMTCTFDYEPRLYLMVAAPPMIGQTYTLQNFSEMTAFQWQNSTTRVDVDVTRDSGMWTFSFKES
ncbi:MAG: hypothetical protein MJA83_06175 [Gammaproteobacteria bacterium]|nr:hypothetical protein [Gammaproteobacteria bacterium]